MVILVTGANGQLGQSIKKVESNYPEFTFIYQNSQELDITNLDSCKVAFEKYKPQYCINTAAYTAVDKAETDQEKAFLVNQTGAKNLALVCKEFEATLLHVSTDFVFDGENTSPYKTTDATNPINVYGLSKLKGEEEIAEIVQNYFVVRTSWVYSEFGNNFKKTMLRLAETRDEISVVNDQIGRPTYAPNLAVYLLDLIKNKNTDFGIHNYADAKICSWYEFALDIFKENNIQIKVNPIPASQYPTPAKRPKYSVLDVK